jgi:hypothetical protein
MRLDEAHPARGPLRAVRRRRRLVCARRTPRAGAKPLLRRVQGGLRQLLQAHARPRQMSGAATTLPRGLHPRQALARGRGPAPGAGSTGQPTDARYRLPASVRANLRRYAIGSVRSCASLSPANIHLRCSWDKAERGLNGRAEPLRARHDALGVGASVVRRSGGRRRCAATRARAWRRHRPRGMRGAS